MNGMEALAEAARRESALVYGTTHREHRQPRPNPNLAVQRDQILTLRAAGQSVASIAFRLGLTKHVVAQALEAA